MQPNASDSPRRRSLWLIAHERDDPMILSQAEYAREDAPAELKRRLRAHASNGLHVEPPEATLEIGRRYDVSDSNGWFATYWLSEQQIASDEGMLTAVASPGARQRGHQTTPLP